MSEAIEYIDMRLKQLRTAIARLEESSIDRVTGCMDDIASVVEREGVSRLEATIAITMTYFIMQRSIHAEPLEEDETKLLNEDDGE